jgi:hypothetical protein
MKGSHGSTPERGRRGRRRGGAMGVATQSSWLPHACSLYVACCCGRKEKKEGEKREEKKKKEKKGEKNVEIFSNLKISEK